jgi:hypothetical protein
MPVSWSCIDCGVNTAPGCSTRAELQIAFATAAVRGEEGCVNQRFNTDSEVYAVLDTIWRAAGMERDGGCLCIGCVEKRLGRALCRKDFIRNHPFNQVPATERLMRRQRRKHMLQN